MLSCSRGKYRDKFKDYQGYLQAIEEKSHHAAFHMPEVAILQTI
jgi:hypothetical protein